MLFYFKRIELRKLNYFYINLKLLKRQIKLPQLNTSFEYEDVLIKGRCSDDGERLEPLASGLLWRPHNCRGSAVEQISGIVA